MMPDGTRDGALQPDEVWLGQLLDRFIDEVREGRDIDLGPWYAQRPHLEARIQEACRTAQVAAPRRVAPAPRVRGYEIVRLLGQGGQGSVYLAEQASPVRRLVALKVVRGDADTGLVLRRFDSERQALARMQHEAVARIFDAGASEDGRPYFAMEYVEGAPITTACDARCAPLTARLELFMLVCAGVAHAHRKGIIHRDLKPSNVLLTGDPPAPKVIDFGLAKAVQPADEGSLLTASGAIVGTLDYMSPEQAGMPDSDVDTRTDVYALGVLLYELLVGRVPFKTSGNLLELQRRILTEEPRTPSSHFAGAAAGSAEVAARRGSEPGTFARLLRGDLDRIVLCALEKRPEDRYQTAEALAADVQAYLRHEPIAVGPRSIAYRLRKFVRRHRVSVGAAAVLAITGLVAVVLTTSANARAREYLSDFEQLALPSRVSRLRELHLQLPAWPSAMADLDAWLVEADAIRSQAADLEATRARLAAISETAGTALSRLDRARVQLRSAVERTGAEIEAVFAPGSDRTRILRKRSIATRLAARTPTEAAKWVRAAHAVAHDPRFAGFVLTPQEGLLPLEENPHSHLWEFYDLASAAEGEEAPERGADGEVRVGEGTGIVFVLLPGGQVRWGAQKDRPGAPYYDPMAEVTEELLHVTKLAPFLLAKHELTQGQWMRLWDGGNPSTYMPETAKAKTANVLVTLAHPVENVSFDQCASVLRVHGMRLPQEAEWEYACRAGTATIWSTGDDPVTLQEHANVADRTLRTESPSHIVSSELEDGYAFHAPVGRFRPNAFRLCDMHGNVSEWCAYDYEAELAARNGVGNAPGTRFSHMERGGSWLYPADFARSAARAARQGGYLNSDLGLRPARSLR